MFAMLHTTMDNIKRHGSVALLSLVLLFIVGFDGGISRIDGFILVAAFVLYLLLIARGDNGEEVPDIPDHRMWQAVAWLIVGLVVLSFSADLAVDSVTDLAAKWGVSEAVVAILILGLGTSLPELSLAVEAIRRQRHELTVGNLVGSNIFDTLVPIGVAGVIAPMTFKQTFLLFDIPMLLLVTALALALLGIKPGLVRWRALILIAVYTGYAVARTGMTNGP
jgi:cation:H+ antiporter